MSQFNCVSSICRFLTVSALLAALSACATDGVIEGRLSGQPVKLNYQHTFWLSTGQVVDTTF